MISKSTAKESPLYGESNIDNKKRYDLADFILKSRGDKETHNAQIINDEKCQYFIESKKCFEAETLINKSRAKSNKILKYLDLINIPGSCIAHT